MYPWDIEWDISWGPVDDEDELYFEFDDEDPEPIIEDEDGEAYECLFDFDGNLAGLLDSEDNFWEVWTDVTDEFEEE